MGDVPPSILEKATAINIPKSQATKEANHIEKEKHTVNNYLEAHAAFCFGRLLRLSMSWLRQGLYPKWRTLGDRCRHGGSIRILARDNFSPANGKGTRRVSLSLTLSNLGGFSGEARREF